MILAGGTKRAQEHAAFALASLGADNVENQKQITALLVSCLSNGTPEAKANATSLLERLVEENPTSQHDIATAGPISDLIGLLKDGSDGAKRFALWSLSLSINVDNQKTLLEEGAIEPLVAALQSEVSTTRQQAAAAISRLATKNNKAQNEIAKQGGIGPLIAIVKGKDDAEAPSGAAEASGGGGGSSEAGGASDGEEVHVDTGRHISPHLPTSPHISPHLPISPHISPHLLTYPHISPHLLTYPHISPHLPTYPMISPYLPTISHDLS